MAFTQIFGYMLICIQDVPEVAVKPETGDMYMYKYSCFLFSISADSSNKTRFRPSEYIFSFNIIFKSHDITQNICNFSSAY